MAAGRPRKYKTANQLQKAVDEYWDNLVGPPTVTGLALALGFADRRSFYDYEQNGEFSYTIKRARTQVENFAEQRLYSSQPAGAIFALKNFGWSDKQETHLTGGLSLDHKVDLSKLTDEELEALEKLTDKATGN